MELSSRALFAQELYPTWTSIEERFEQIGRGVTRRADSVARSRRPEGKEAGNRPPTERSNAEDGLSRPSRSPHDSERGDNAGRTDENDQVTVLVLALDTYNARVYHDMLEVRGYFPVTAPNVDSWQRVLGQCKPDLILMDLCSSDHPSVAIARRIMNDPSYKSVPIIMVTDVYKSGDLNDPATVITDFDGRIAKPISVDGFYKPIEEILKHATVRRNADP